MKILITGITGYIGSRLAKALLPEHTVYGLVRQPVNLTYWPPELPEKPVFLSYDGTGESVLVALETSQPDVVFHLATHYTAAHDIQTIPNLLESNLVFGCYLLEAMCATKCKHLVYTTTVTTHCSGQGYKPLTLYAASKQAFSDLVEFYVREGELCAAAVALSDTYGPQDQRPKVLNLLRQSILEKVPVDLTSGKQIYDAVYIDDVVDGLMKAAKAKENVSLPHTFFQLASPSPLTLRETAELMLQVNGVQYQPNWGARPDPVQRQDFPIRLYPIVPGWHPKTSLEEGLQKFWTDSMTSGGDQFG